jgi:glycosyltransferase involved in cell wall biosynthesis
MKRVLIITYYWPPAGGAGVQRWLKFVKYLRNFGIEPIIYTPSNPEIPVEDISLLKDIPHDITVLQQPIWEPYHWYKKWVGIKPSEKINTGFLSESEKPKKTESIGVWVRGNFFIPDARCFWIQPSIRFLTTYLQSQPVDAIITTGPPHSMHRIGLGLKKATGIPWIADFRDPWTNIDFYDQLMLTRWADRLHRKMELEVIQNADHVITVTSQDALDFKNKGAHATTQITNGFDDEFKSNIALDNSFTLVHVGSIPPARNHDVLWKVIQYLTKTHSEFSKHFQLKLIGKTDISVRNSIRAYGLEQWVQMIPYMNHEEAVMAQQKAQLLLLLVNNSLNSKSILTGKFFEYLAARRPIIAIGPEDGEVAEILQKSQAGDCVDFDNESELGTALLRRFSEWKEKGNCTLEHADIEQYSRKSLTQQLSLIIHQVTK